MIKPFQGGSRFAALPCATYFSQSSFDQKHAAFNFLSLGLCQGTPNPDPQLYPPSIVCTSSPSLTSDKDWLVSISGFLRFLRFLLFLCFLCFLRFSVSPFLWNSVTPLRSHTTTQSLHRSVSLFLCYLVFLLSFISSPFYLFVSPLFRNSGTPILWFFDSPVLRFSGSPEFRSYGELFNLHFFTSFTFINGLMVVSFFASVISVPRDPVSQGPLFHRPWHVCKYI